MANLADILDQAPTEDGVVLLTQPQPEFETAYLSVRDKEERVLSDELARMLPHLPEGNRHAAEWQLRSGTLQAIREYQSKRPELKTVLDLGCGNGWLARHLAKTSIETFYGVDMNLLELKQAQRLAEGGKCRFLHADIFKDWPVLPAIDWIIINAAVQYFPDLPALLNHLLKLLAPNGEIHLLDSPFYNAKEVPAARQRTVEYYEKQGVPEMADHYHHHTWDDLEGFRSKVLYDPAAFKNRLIRKMTGEKRTPFSWVMVTKA